MKHLNGLSTPQLRSRRSVYVGRLIQARKATDELAPHRVGNILRELDNINSALARKTEATR